MKTLTYIEFKRNVTVKPAGKAFIATYSYGGRDFHANGESENFAILNLMEYLSDEHGFTILED